MGDLELRTVKSNVNCIYHKFFNLWQLRNNSPNESNEI